jgi:hypothetical protein
MQVIGYIWRTTLTVTFKFSFTIVAVLATKITIGALAVMLPEVKWDLENL